MSFPFEFGTINPVSRDCAPKVSSGHGLEPARGFCAGGREYVMNEDESEMSL